MVIMSGNLDISYDEESIVLAIATHELLMKRETRFWVHEIKLKIS